MGRRWTQSRDDAGELMARSGGAPKTRTRTLSTVSATCIVAATVQESLWNHKLWRSQHRPLWHHWLSLEAAVGMGASRTYNWVPLVIPKVLVLEPTSPSIIWIPFHMESQTKITGIAFPVFYLCSIWLLRKCRNINESKKFWVIDYLRMKNYTAEPIGPYGYQVEISVLWKQRATTEDKPFRFFTVVSIKILNFSSTK